MWIIIFDKGLVGDHSISVSKNSNKNQMTISALLSIKTVIGSIPIYPNMC